MSPQEAVGDGPSSSAGSASSSQPLLTSPKRTCSPIRRLQQPSDNPYLDRSDRLGYDLLQKHGFLPEWIDQQKEIRKAHENAMRALAGAWLDCDEEPCTRWLAHRDAFQESIAALNKRVRDYNLICPAASQMPHFVFTEELRRFGRVLCHGGGRWQGKHHVG